MPCRCCGAYRPSKGFTEYKEKEIHSFLTLASDLILSSRNESDDISDWKKGWQEAFDHMLNGCPEKDLNLNEFLKELQLLISKNIDFLDGKEVFIQDFNVNFSKYKEYHKKVKDLLNTFNLN